MSIEPKINSTQGTVFLLGDIRQIIERGRREAYVAANQGALRTYWNIGRRIVEKRQGGENRAKYGTQLLQTVATELTREYGKGFTHRDLEKYRQFYLAFSDSQISPTCGQNSDNNLEIMHTRMHNLDWSHYRVIMREATPEGRAWYVKIVYAWRTLLTKPCTIAKERQNEVA